MRRQTLAALAIGLAASTTAAAGDRGDVSPEGLMFMEMGFGGATAQPLMNKLRYGFHFDVAHGFELGQRPKVLRMEFNGNEFAPMGLGRMEVGGVNILTTHYRLNATGAFEGYSIIDFGLLAVGVAGLAAIGTQVFDEDETPEPEPEPPADGGGDDGGDDGGGDVPAPPDNPLCDTGLPLPGCP